MRQHWPGILALAAAFVAVGLVLLATSTAEPTELFDSEDADFFGADSVYSASPSQDQSARVEYSTSDEDGLLSPSDENQARLFSRSRSIQRSTSLSAGSVLSLFGGVNDEDRDDVSDDALATTSGSSDQMLAVVPNNRQSNGGAATYRGSLAGLSRLRRAQSQDGNSNAIQVFPTPLQRRLESSERRNDLSSLQEITAPVRREAAEIRRRWIEAEQQQREDRAKYRNSREEYSEPGRPFNIAHPRLAQAKKLAQIRRRAEEKSLQNQALAQTQPQGGEDAFAALAEQQDINAKKASSTGMMMKERNFAPRMKSAVNAAISHAKKSQNNNKNIKNGHDISHVEAIDAIESALEDHSATDRMDSKVRHAVAERLHRKAEKLQEVGQNQREEEERQREQKHDDLHKAKEDELRARQLQARVGQLLHDSRSEHNHDIHNIFASSSTDPTTAAETSLVKDEKKEQKDELALANEAVREQSLNRHHKGISLALQAKMTTLRARINKDVIAVNTDRAALENIASPDVNTRYSKKSIDMSPTSAHGVVYDDTQRAKLLLQKAKMLRKHAQALETKAANSKYAKETISVATKCLRHEADKLDNNEGRHSHNAHTLYAHALKKCGLA